MMDEGSPGLKNEVSGWAAQFSPFRGGAVVIDGKVQWLSHCRMYVHRDIGVVEVRELGGYYLVA